MAQHVADDWRVVHDVSANREFGRIGRREAGPDQSNWSRFNEGCAVIAGSLAFGRIRPSDEARQLIAEGRRLFGG
ncbi:hypothetical protein ACCT14_26055 [Rhizobium brockwellii]|jgi:hypothetical protein|uniref:hypothetical protein n=1 Tax=Rhizobium TaxID=379 RepID=UPI00102FA831|nr:MULTISPECIES: hypothetical protein [Rhizobium]MDV4182971.1 hypothetical protein [Rhizobium brockwellii]TAX26518.1 hypothetical protein ELI06_25600 [Rhizobium leguminosarum]